MKELPESANTVILGAGIVGNSVAYGLAEQGAEDIVLIDKGPLPDPGGSTGHASNFSFPITDSKVTTQLGQRSREIYEEMDAWEESGGIEVARTEERLKEFDRKMHVAKAWDEPAEQLTVEEVKEEIPFINEDIIKGGFYSTKAGVADPLYAGEVMRERAKEKGVLTVFPNTEVTDIDVDGGEVTAVETDKGRIEANRVVNCTGIWSPKIAEMAGSTLPLVPIVHQMVSVGPISQFEDLEGLEYPVIRDMDTKMYERQHGADLETGSYAHKTMIWDIEDIPSIEEAPLSPTQPPLTEEEFEESMEHALEIVPEILDDPGAGIHHQIDGLMAQTPDINPLVGPDVEVDGLWNAVAIYVRDAPAVGEELGKWMEKGHMDIDLDNILNTNRFYEYGNTIEYTKERTYEGFPKYYGIIHPKEQWESGRPMRTTGFYDAQEELEAEFFEAYGWETPQWYESNEDLLDVYRDEIADLRRPNDWDSDWWSPIILAEHLHMRDNVALIDGSPFSVFDIEGPGALDLVQKVSVGQMDVKIGKTVYTPVLRNNGRFRSDFTVARVDDDHFRVVTSGGTGGADLQWFKENAPDDGSVHITSLSDSLATIGIWGPEARNVLDPITKEDLTNDAHPFGYAQEITIGDVKAWAIRISYVGELGWEIHVPISKSRRLWNKLYEAGQEYNIRPVGMGVYGTTGRIEKSFQLIGADMDQEYTAAEAGRTRLGLKDEDFIGKAEYSEYLDETPVAKIATLSVDDHAPDGGERRFMIGHPPIVDENGDVLKDSKGRTSFVTSAGTGPSVGKHLMMAYLPIDLAEVGQQLYVEYFGQQYPVTVESVGTTPVFDPDHSRMFQ